MKPAHHPVFLSLSEKVVHHLYSLLPVFLPLLLPNNFLCHAVRANHSIHPLYIPGQCHSDQYLSHVAFSPAFSQESAIYPSPHFATHCQLPLVARSEEHTSELQSRENLVCRLLLEKKKNVQ